MSILNRIARFARSPQGRRLASQAGRYARSPQGRARLEGLRRQIAGRGKSR
jgi:hypothetical protein